MCETDLGGAFLRAYGVTPKLSQSEHRRKLRQIEQATRREANKFGIQIVKPEETSHMSPDPGDLRVLEPNLHKDQDNGVTS